MTRPPSGSPFPPDAGDDGHDGDGGEDTAALERELGRFFATPTPASLRSRVLAESNRYRREQRPPPGLHADHPAETAATPDHQEAPMRTAPPQTVLAFPGQPSTRSARPAPSGHRDGPAFPRTLRRVGRDSLGLVASLALIVLVALSAIAVYDGTPGGDEPTTFAGAGVSTPTVEPTDAAASEPVYETMADGTEYAVIPFAECNVEAVSYDRAISTIIGNYRRTEDPSSLADLATGSWTADGVRWSFSGLPAGPVPVQDTIESVVRLYSTYEGCGSDPLRQAAMFTQAGFFRQVYSAPSFGLGGEPNGEYLLDLWLGGQGQTISSPASLGGTSGSYLYDFRLLPDGDVVAYLAFDPMSAAEDSLPTFYENAGYVLFTQQDGDWLIDEQLRP